MNEKLISGFSKLNKLQKIEWLTKNFTKDREQAIKLIKQYWNSDDKIQELHEEFIENTLSNFYIPWSIAPNFVINGKNFAVPMVIEESSVVAAASKTAKFWADKGGFKAEVTKTNKVGQVHFIYKQDNIKEFYAEVYNKFWTATESITQNMRNRGGGILSIELVDKTKEMANYYQILAKFETVDSMGANFINTCLEKFAGVLSQQAEDWKIPENDFEVVMSILSNYTPECLVKVEVEAPVSMLEFGELKGEVFCEKFSNAISIAKIDPYRACTHNKGIFNGIDSVVMATGNDFRAVEAAGHLYASVTGKHSTLTDVSIKNGMFKFWLEMPMSIGTIGGITNLHPLVKLSLDILGNPNAKDLMKIIASVGLTQNFAAVGSLVTTGIQKGHMKMHLLNILNQLKANSDEKNKILDYFKTRMVSFSEVENQLNLLRKK